MKRIYIVCLNDEGPIKAFKTEEKAKNYLWGCYLDDYDEESLNKYSEQDAETLRESNYIEDYGYVVWVGVDFED